MKLENQEQEQDKCKQEFNNILLQRRIEQGYDKKTYPKLLLNILKVMEKFTFIYTPWAPNLKKFFKKLPIYMWPMFTHMS